MLVLILVLAVLPMFILAVRWRRTPRTGESPAAHDARERERAAGAEAERQHAAQVQAADIRREEHRNAEAVEDLNRWLKKRRGGSLALLVCLSPVAARAECVRHGDEVVCAYRDIVELRDGLAELEHERDLARADARLAEDLLKAAHVRIAELEAVPVQRSSTWQWLAGGVAAGVALAVSLAVLTIAAPLKTVAGFPTCS